MCHQLHGDGQGHWCASWLPAHKRTADQGGITAAEKGSFLYTPHASLGVVRATWLINLVATYHIFPLQHMS